VVAMPWLSIAATGCKWQAMHIDRRSSVDPGVQTHVCRDSYYACTGMNDDLTKLVSLDAPGHLPGHRMSPRAATRRCSSGCWPHRHSSPAVSQRGRTATKFQEESADHASEDRRFVGAPGSGVEVVRMRAWASSCLAEEIQDGMHLGIVPGSGTDTYHNWDSE